MHAYDNVATCGADTTLKPLVPSTDNMEASMRDSKMGLSFRKNYYSRFCVGFFVFLGAFFVSALVSSSLTPASLSFADSTDKENSHNGKYIKLSASDDVVLSVDATPIGQSASVKDTINVKTNVETGYKLYITASDANLYSQSDAEHTGSYFASVAGTMDAPTKLTNNTWGFSLNADTNTPIPGDSDLFAAVPTTETEIKSTSTATTEDGDNTDIYYAINADTTMPDGTYSTTITYTVFAEGIDTMPLSEAAKVGDYVYMVPTSTNYVINYSYENGIGPNITGTATLNPSELKEWVIINKDDSTGKTEMVSRYTSTNVFKTYGGMRTDAAFGYTNDDYTTGSRSISSNNDVDLVKAALGTLAATNPRGLASAYWTVYGYGGDACRQTWYQYVVNTSGALNGVKMAYSNCTYYELSTNSYTVRPILTLKESVMVKSSGDGSAENPWVLTAD